MICIAFQRVNTTSDFCSFKVAFNFLLQLEFALDTAAEEAAEYDKFTTKNCRDIIKRHQTFFDGLMPIKDIFVIGHSLSEVDYPYFEEICKKTNAKWYIGYHSLEDLKRLLVFVDRMKLRKVSLFRT